VGAWLCCHRGWIVAGPEIIKIIMGAVPCGVCWDADAVCEVRTVWGWWASLCEDHAGEFGDPDYEWRELVIGPGAGPWQITEAEAARYVESQSFVFARTMPRAPHEYVLLRRSTDPSMHLRTVAWIRANGERRRWRSGHYHTYWTHGFYEYWAMAPRDVILNRRDTRITYRDGSRRLDEQTD